MVAKRPQSGSVDAPAPPAEPQPATEWSHHEHVTSPMKAQAKKLVDEAGSPELAKQAVDAAGKLHVVAADKDEFARRLEFTSYLDLFEASTAAASVEGKNWFITALRGGGWIVWNDVDLIASDLFSSPENARRHLPASAGPGP